jgi:hypothetical protein
MEAKPWSLWGWEAAPLGRRRHEGNVHDIPEQIHVTHNMCWHNMYCRALR